MNMDELYKPLPAYPVGSILTFYLPFVGSWIENANLWFRNIEGDLIMDLFPSQNIKVSGNGSVDCNDISFIIETESLTDEDLAVQEKFYAKVPSEINFLDVTPVNFYNQKLSAASQNKLELDSLRGEYAFLLVCIRAVGATNQNEGLQNYVGLGPNGSIDILDPGSKSILGSGQSIDETYLRNFVYPQHWSNDLNSQKNMYYIPFGGDGRSALSGARDGSLYFDGSRYYLSLTPAQVGVSRKQLITSSAAVGTGFVQYEFDGKKTKPIAVDAVAQVVEDALNNLCSFKHYPQGPLTCTVVHDPASPGLFHPIITFSSNVDIHGKEVNKVNYSGSIAGVSFDNVIQVEGKQGFKTDDYDIAIYGYKYSKMLSMNGKLSIQE